MANYSNKYEFCFHSVGHGLFYTGKIDRFWFIYDCGSNSISTIKRKVENFCKIHLNQGRLPFLFLSHLHKDHISGLGILFSCVKVDYVFMPYLSPWERLLLALLAPDEISTWYIDFLSDPIEYLIKKRTKVVLITSIRNEGKELDFETINLDYLPDVTIHLDGLKILDEKTAEDLLKEEINSELKNYYKKDLIVASPIPKSNQIPRLWEFILYNIPMPEKELKCFRKQVEQLINDTQFFSDSIIKNFNPLLILSDQILLKKLKFLYERLVNKKEKMNLTSLLLWHSPLNLKHMKANLRFGYCNEYNASCGQKELRLDLCSLNPDCLAVSVAAATLKDDYAKCGQLLTGDLNFKCEKIYNDFKNFFGNKLTSTLICSLPHHGSKNNWKQELLNDIRPGEIWVVSAGKKSDRYPPHKDVIMDIVQNGKMLFSTSNNKDFVISFDCI